MKVIEPENRAEESQLIDILRKLFISIFGSNSPGIAAAASSASKSESEKQQAKQ
jgi:hypothetical protein